ncbi:hypothetical protein [Paraburkholderia sp. 32]|uniref:hypothetical protein n=1 Tax=Paraburkholderia sp. 32 TaxID=2991057 RepID=UPI003D21E73D
MSTSITIRRLRIRGLAPRDYPAPAELEQRLIDAARCYLPQALEHAMSAWSSDAVLRIRRLDLDITLDTAFDPQAFGASLARAITRELHRAEASGGSGGGSSGIVCYASRQIYLAALLEALAAKSAADHWWLGDADGLRFLSQPQAIRTTLLAEARLGLEALASLSPLRRAVVLRTLTPLEADRVLDGFARTGAPAASLADCVSTIATAVAALPEGASAPELFVGGFAQRPGLAGPALAAAARLWARLDEARHDAVKRGKLDELPDELVRSLLTSVAETATRSISLADARRALAPALSASRSTEAANAYYFSRFGGLLLLLPDLGMTDIENITAGWPDAQQDTAALIGYATLGLCAGRERFADWLDDLLWRQLFGLDLDAPAAALTSRLGAISADAWASLVPLLAPLDHPCNIRFLLAQRTLTGSRTATRTLAGLARAALKRFARRLPGFGDPSAPFLWDQLLGITAAFERGPCGWSAQLSRPPLDVLLSLARVAEGSVPTPCGAVIAISRISP